MWPKGMPVFPKSEQDITTAAVHIIPTTLLLPAAFRPFCDMHHVSYRHAASALVSFGMERLAFCKSSVCTKKSLTSPSASFAFCSMFVFVSKRSGQRKPLAERSAWYTFYSPLESLQLASCGTAVFHHADRTTATMIH